ncbi:MAG: beta strand repeat-containing protein [Bryobacteraceae bacterium]
MKRTLRLLTVLPFVIFLSNTIPTGFAQKLNFSVKTKAAGRPAPGGQVFGAAQTYASGFGGSTQSVAADLNGDGVPDLAILNPCNSSYCGSGYASVAVMIGNGDGSFQAPVLYATGSFQPMSLAAGDFNNDGAVDLVVASQCASSVNCGTGQVIVLLGNGDGTFQSPVPYSTGNGSSYFVVTADFNGDGNLDLAVANQTSGNSTLAIMLGNGDGTFQAPAAYSTGAASAVFLAVADFNMDGAADLVAANGGTADSVSVLLGNGDGTFQNPVIYPSGGAIANAAAVADFNGDGVPDLAVVNGCATYTNLSCSPNGSVGILLGNGDGTFQPPVAYGSAGNSPSSIAVADFNGDGNIDLAVANAAPPGGASGDGSLSLLLGNGAGTFQSAVTYDAGGTYSASISAADFNSDGQPDVAVVNQCPSMGACANGIDGVLLNAVSKPNLYASSTALSAAANPSGPNQAVLLTATLSAPQGTPTGSITFYDGSTALSTATVANGQAAYTASFSTAGPHALEAVYSGDGSHAGSASAVVRETVGALMALASSANPSILSNAVTFTAAVAGSGPLPTGAVTFMDGATTLGTVPLANGSAAIGSSSLAAGNHSITASYSGDSNYLPGAAALVQAVSQATTTAVSSSANPSSSNQPVVFTASVTAQSGVVNGGTVAFMQGSPPTTWGTAQVVNGQATLSNSFSRNNTYPITAAYLGSPAYQSSAATAINQVVSGSQTVSTSTTLQSSGSPSYVNQPVTFTATVNPLSGSIPDGETVTFFNGTTTLGTGATSGGVAVFTTASLPLGTNSITATYPGDSTYLTSTSRAFTQVVKVTPTNTTLASTLNPSTYGQAVTFNVTVTPQMGSGTPTGSVTVKNGGSSLGSIQLSNGSGSLTTSTLTAGSLSITASYSGDTNFGSSTATLSQTVNVAPTATTVTSTPNPSSLNQAVTLTAMVTGEYGGKVSGNVTFTQGSTVLGTSSPVLGKASLNYTFSTTGTFPVVATYSGDTNDSGSASTAYDQTVGNISTTTTLSTSGTPSYGGQTVTFTAAVTPSSGTVPSGEAVTFYDGTATIGTGSTAGGVAVFATSTLAVGKHSITATYAGDATYQTSTSKAVLQTVSLNGSTTTLVSDTNPSAYGQPVTLTATVTASAGALVPTGKVSFKNGSTIVAQVTLVNGVAAYTSSTFAAGSLPLQASYGGDANFSTSAASLTQVVNQAVTTTTLSSNHNPASLGETVKFTAIVTAQYSGSVTGSIQFMNGSTALATVSLLRGTASYSYAFSTAGTESITAVYSGDGNNQASTSAVVSQVVNVASTTTTVTSNASTASVGQSVTFTATVASSYGAIPSGELVTFYDGANQIGTGNTASGAATYTTSMLTAGAHKITATYAGDSSFQSSTSKIFLETINAATTTTVLTSNANPSGYGQPVTFTATVTSTGSAPTGTISFKNGTTPLGVATLNSQGVATMTTLTLAAGSYSITAAYSGDASSAKSTSPPVNQVVNQAATTTQLVSSVNPAALGESVTFTAIVRSATTFATGTVTFTAGSTVVGTGTLVNGSTKLALTTLPAGATTVTATYAGSSNVAGSSGAIIEYVE